ncbi:MAG TPA: sulfotransferase [Caulobacterales bacterium]|nr:sulfotransferase [Caulobacterales bacterium]
MASDAPQPTGSLVTALAHAERLLERDPMLALQQAGAILEAAPGHPAAQLIQGKALRLQGKVSEARVVLEALARAEPRAAQARFELGVTLAAQGDAAAAISQLREAVALKDAFPPAWGALGDLHTLAGAGAEADSAYANQIRTSTSDPDLMQAAHALCEGRLAAAEALLRERLKASPTDVAAIRMLAEIGARLGRYGDAEKLLARALELAPSFAPARHNLALVLFRQGKALDALREIESLRKTDPGNAIYRNLKAAALARLGDYDNSITQFEDVLRDQPDQPRLWLSYGHSLKTAGRTQDAIAAYRKAIALDPDFGDGFWSLANLKTFRFTPEEIQSMRAALARADLAAEDRYHLHFALGKALEDAGAYADSFAHYQEGARQRRAFLDYEPDEITDQVRRTKALFTPSFLASRQGMGSPATDPIFVIGLPRSGSTLLEQILSSHSQIEGTMELPDIAAIARELGERKLKSEASKYPQALAELAPAQLRALGESYLERTRIQRRSAKPLFIDKMPNNWIHVGLIALILPNAKIIDARRDPMATCFSAFKQHFARGQAFTYDLAELGRYYRDYLDLMAHFDTVAPGRVYRVFYERLVADTEPEVRRVLDYCGLDFEEACLSFYATERAVRTASSEQVRQPIFRDGLDQWRRYEPWLGPLKAALAGAPEHQDTKRGN